MTNATREDFLKAAETKPGLHPVDLPALGKTVHVKKFSVRDRSWFESHLAQGEKLDPENPQVRALLIVACLTDEYGCRLFTSDDLAWIQESDFQIFEPAVDVADQIGNLAMTSVRDHAKNSGKTNAGG